MCPQIPALSPDSCFQIPADQLFDWRIQPPTAAGRSPFRSVFSHVLVVSCLSCFSWFETFTTKNTKVTNMQVPMNQMHILVSRCLKKNQPAGTPTLSLGFVPGRLPYYGYRNNACSVCPQRFPHRPVVSCLSCFWWFETFTTKNTKVTNMQVPMNQMHILIVCSKASECVLPCPSAASRDVLIVQSSLPE